MCGLSGFIPSSRIDHSELENISLYMGNALLHRGPDAYGSWIEKDNRLVFSFRRLAIQDLSSTGNQPMRSMTNRYVIVFNGEIYNHLRIRDLLKRVQNKNLQWNGSSDTETILTAIECWGIKETLNHLHGMFAIAIFDKKLKKLTLARDRMGEKPLYYGVINGSFVFASELKALKKFPNFNNAVSKKSIAKFLQYNFVPAPLSIYENIFKLNPGALIEIDVSSDSFKVGEQQSFWSIDSKKDSQKDLHDNEHTIKNLERSLSQVVKDQMISDVPLGAFLSGGIDSSLIVALMQANSTDPIKTFTVGFEESKFDESFFAKQVADHLNTDHTEIILHPRVAQDLIFDLPIIYDEPFADSSQIPTFLISQIAKNEVTVALSGDGGDEVFGGYNRYIWAPNIWSNLKKIPRGLRPLIASALNSIPQRSFSVLETLINLSKPQAAGIDALENKILKLSKLLTSTSPKNLYDRLISHWPDSSLLVKGLNETDLIFNDSMYKNFPENFSFSKDFISSMMLIDSLHYLPGDILCKVDRASMANSLETRAPFLDHKLVELAQRLPTTLKVKDGVGKVALRKILFQYVPKELIERPKTGFNIPIAEWLRGPLKSWADELLSEQRINADGYLNFKPIQLIWQQHLSERHDWSDRLWGILMLQTWLEKN